MSHGGHREPPRERGVMTESETRCKRRRTNVQNEFAIFLKIITYECFFI